ncbi:MAG: chorismate synthase, partial [Firmicutes bacterium]|nr:chorismate synthase [Bacillota bacterium]
MVSFEIINTDTRSADYKALAKVPRPGHADYTARLRYGDQLNMAGGGSFS